MAALLLIGLFAAPYALHRSSQLNVNTLAPQRLVETYYRSLAVGDFVTAKACLSEELAQFLTVAEDSDFRNLRWLTDLSSNLMAWKHMHFHTLTSP